MSDCSASCWLKKKVAKVDDRHGEADGHYVEADGHHVETVGCHVVQKTDIFFGHL